jgi:hypothetical protein
MRRIYVRETEYMIIDSVYEPFEDMPMLEHAAPPRRGGKLLLFGALVALLVVFGHDLGAKAQSNVRQFYGWGDYGSGPNVYVAPGQTIIVPVPVYPQYLTPDEQRINMYGLNCDAAGRCVPGGPSPPAAQQRVLPCSDPRAVGYCIQK